MKNDVIKELPILKVKESVILKSLELLREQEKNFSQLEISLARDKKDCESGSDRAGNELASLENKKPLLREKRKRLLSKGKPVIEITKEIDINRDELELCQDKIDGLKMRMSDTLRAIEENKESLKMCKIRQLQHSQLLIAKEYNYFAEKAGCVVGELNKIDKQIRNVENFSIDDLAMNKVSNCKAVIGCVDFDENSEITSVVGLGKMLRQLPKIFLLSGNGTAPEKLKKFEDRFFYNSKNIRKRDSIIPPAVGAALRQRPPYGLKPLDEYGNVICPPKQAVDVSDIEDNF